MLWNNVVFLLSQGKRKGCASNVFGENKMKCSDESLEYLCRNRKKPDVPARAERCSAQAQMHCGLISLIGRVSDFQAIRSWRSDTESHHMVEPMFDSIVLHGNVFQWQSEGYFCIKRMLIIDTDWSSTKKDRNKPNAIITTMISKLSIYYHCFRVLSMYIFWWK